MSDLFHEEVPLAFIVQVFKVMNTCAQHTFQILTKRPLRVLEIASEVEWSQNIWLGVSVEDERVVERVSLLQKTPAHVKFLSCEPLIGPLNNLPLAGIHWVIVGGESGPRFRLIEKHWVTSIKRQCLDNGVAFFFKQWGGVNKKSTGRELDGKTWDEMPDTTSKLELI